MCYICFKYIYKFKEQMYCNSFFLNRNIFKKKLLVNVYLYLLYEINKMINK